METNIPKKEIQISHTTKDRVEACKQYVEKKYTKIIIQEKERKENWEQILQKMTDLNLASINQNIIKKQIQQKEGEYLRFKRQKLSAKDYEPLAIIGRGAFGEVRVCRNKHNKEVVAIKKMKKSEMLQKNQIAHIRAERDILALSDQNWVVSLKASFQDDKYLYLVMEYLPGGDLMTLLMQKDILSEHDAKFYIAELILAVESIHKLNYIHRDLKPDNVLIDNQGHVKLSDFGLCKHTDIKPKIDFGRKNPNEVKMEPAMVLTKRPQNFNRKRQLAFSTVGTPDYIAPEVFSQQGYTETVDWWSIGVILFEMVVGYPPFFSDEPQTTCQKIINWKKTFGIPSDSNLSQPCSDLIRRLIADNSERLGINGAAEIKAHPFFQGIEWKRIREKSTPFVPEIKTEIDTDRFEKFEEEEPWYLEVKHKRQKKAHFQGYSYNREAEQRRSPWHIALEELQNMKPVAVKFEKKQQSPIRSTTNNSLIQQSNNNSGRSFIIQEKKQQQQNQIEYSYNLYNSGQNAKSNSPINNKVNRQKYQPLNSARGGQQDQKLSSTEGSKQKCNEQEYTNITIHQ